MSRRRKIVSDLRRQGADPLIIMTTERRLRLDEHRNAIEELEKDLRVLECFGPMRATWATKSCRHKIRIVLDCGVAMGPAELSRLLGENLNSIRSTLARMRQRGEVQHAGHKKWIRPSETNDASRPQTQSVIVT